MAVNGYGDVETRAGRLAALLRPMFRDELDVDVIAGALVEVLGPLAHERRAVIAGSYVVRGRVQRASVEADCVCYECLGARPVSAANDLL